ncbi:MAG: FG-GAP repeat domain-containing protein, partial [Planctomycetota bacterium]
MRTLGLALAVALVSGMGVRAQERQILHDFEKVQLDADFYSEGASFGDLNGDGQMDLIAGPFWYAGPDFEDRQEIYPAKPFDVARYSDNFFAFVYDFNRDGAQDVFFIGFPGKDASWFENPGKGVGDWQRHRVFEVVDNESPTFADLTGDGLPELICQFEDRLGYAAPNWDAPSEPWPFRPVSPTGAGGNFTHGLGLGDIDGDGRMDLLTRSGWWQQPASLDGDPLWTKHEYVFGERGGAQMYAYDLDGDGDADVISSWNAHGYGLFWYEQIRINDRIDFVPHRIMGEFGSESVYGLVIGNLHAIDLVDMDGDGLKDIVTGARYWAHGGNDKADKEPALLYWLQLQRSEEDGAKGVEFIPWEIDDNSGVGTQVVAGDMTGDGLPDVVVSNKMGTFFHRHSTREVSRNEFLAQRRKDFTAMRARSAEIDRTGVLPLGADGEALNLDFESGDMRDWTA